MGNPQIVETRSPAGQQRRRTNVGNSPDSEVQLAGHRALERMCLSLLSGAGPLNYNGKARDGRIQAHCCKTHKAPSLV